MDNTVIEVVEEEHLLKGKSRCCILLFLLLVVKDPKSPQIFYQLSVNVGQKSKWTPLTLHPDVIAEHVIPPRVDTHLLLSQPPLFWVHPFHQMFEPPAGICSHSGTKNISEVQQCCWVSPKVKFSSTKPLIYGAVFLSTGINTLEQERDKNKLLKPSWKHFIV